MTTNNTIENNIYYSSSHAREIAYGDCSFYSDDWAQEKEQKNLFNKIFLLRKAADPAVEADRFIAYNKARNWTTSDGRAFETAEQRMALAGLWKFEGGEAQGTRLRYVEAIAKVVKDAKAAGMTGAEVLVDSDFGIEWNKKENRWYWSISIEAHAWIYGCKERQDIIHKHLDTIFGGIPVSFRNINQ